MSRVGNKNQEIGRATRPSNRTGLTAPDGSTVTYVYDTLNRLATLTDSQAGQFGFSYDALGRRKGLTRPNGVNSGYNYDSLSHLTSVLHTAGTTTLDGASYTYDNAGNRTSKTNYLNNVTEQYTYDPLYQLTQVTQGLTTTESYSYDPVGNRLSSLGMSPYAYNSSNELTSTPTDTFTYDNNGNTTSKADGSGTTSYTWDFENRLIEVVLPGASGTLTFKYDPLGHRIQKSSSSVTTVYLHDGNNSIAEMDATGSLVARYTQSLGIDRPLAQFRNGAVGYYEQDGLGSVTALSSATGAIESSYTYDSFGNLNSTASSSANSFQYTGREFDTETGLRFYRARYYDPINGRFINEDPIRFTGGRNFYRYVGNNPVKWVDPFGLFPDGCIDCVIDMIQCFQDGRKCREKMDHDHPDLVDLCEAASADVGYQVGNPDDAYFLLCFAKQPSCQRMFKSCGRCGVKPPFGMTKGGNRTPDYNPKPGSSKTPTKFPPDYPGRPLDDPLNDPFASK